MWQTWKHGRENPAGLWLQRRSLLQRAAYNSRKYIQINSGRNMQVSSYAWLGAMGWISKHFLSKKRRSSGKTAPYSQCCLFPPSSTPLGLGVFCCAPIGLFALYMQIRKAQCFWVWENKLVTQHLFQLKKRNHTQFCLWLRYDYRFKLQFSKKVSTYYSQC